MEEQRTILNNRLEENRAYVKRLKKLRKFQAEDLENLEAAEKDIVALEGDWQRVNTDIVNTMRNLQ